MEWAAAHSPRPRGIARDKYSSEKTQGHRLLPPTDPYHHEYVDAGSPGLLVRKSNSFLMKQKGLGRVFSREPGNLAAFHSYKHAGLVNDKSVGIVPAENRGVVVTTRKQKTSPRAIRGARASTTMYVCA